MGKVEKMRYLLRKRMKAKRGNEKQVYFDGKTKTEYEYVFQLASYIEEKLKNIRRHGRKEEQHQGGLPERNKMCQTLRPSREDTETVLISYMLSRH